MLDHDAHGRRQLARERVERIERDYRVAQRLDLPEPGRLRRAEVLLARIRRPRARRVPAYRQ